MKRMRMTKKSFNRPCSKITKSSRLGYADLCYNGFTHQEGDFRMKKLLVFILLPLLSFGLAACDFFGQTTTTSPVTVETEPEIFLEIATAAELRAMEVTKSYVLIADIDLEGSEWLPIGTVQAPFSGWFDGDGHTISNYVISQKNNDYNGLFGIATGKIMDLTISNFDINYSTSFLTYAGGLAGQMTGDVDHVTVEGDIHVINLESNTYAGLLTGFHSALLTDTMTVTEFVPGSVSNVSATGSVFVTTENFAYVGGLIGKAFNIHLEDSDASAVIDAVSRNFRVYVGGLIGHNFSGILSGYEDIVESVDITIERCHAVADITIHEGGTWASAGGLIGYNQYGVILDSYAFSHITLNSDDHHYLGGLIGEDWNGKISNSVAVTNVDLAPDDTVAMNLTVSGLVGSVNSESVITISFFAIDFTGVITSVAGTMVTADNLASSTWYEGTLLWDINSIDIPEAIANLTQD